MGAWVGRDGIAKSEGGGDGRKVGYVNTWLLILKHDVSLHFWNYLCYLASFIFLPLSAKKKKVSVSHPNKICFWKHRLLPLKGEKKKKKTITLVSGLKVFNVFKIVPVTKPGSRLQICGLLTIIILGTSGAASVICYDYSLFSLCSLLGTKRILAFSLSLILVSSANKTTCEKKKKNFCKRKSCHHC